MSSRTCLHSKTSRTKNGNLLMWHAQSNTRSLIDSLVMHRLIMGFAFLIIYTISCYTDPITQFSFNNPLICSIKNNTAFTDQYPSSAEQFATSTLCTLAAHGVRVILTPQSLTVNIKRRNFSQSQTYIVQLFFSAVQIS